MKRFFHYSVTETSGSEAHPDVRSHALFYLSSVY